ncbi:MAG: protein of unknown function with transrane region [Candidatus Kaiserbacteria bacterium]|nr:protein of unknown function with transrane region [Candidatus Kaiserbacteria bacterium]
MYSRSLSDKLHEKPRHALDLTRQAVGEDWAQPEPEASGMMVAPRMIGYTRKLLWWFLAAAVTFFVCALLFFAYYFLFGAGSSHASASNIDIAVSGPSEIAGGEATKLQLVVTNHNSVALELAELVITYPPGTRSPSDFKTDFPSQRIPLGTIEPGGTRQGTISAVFAGAQGTHATVKVELEYHITGSNAVFLADSDYDVAFGSSPVTVAVDGNTETVSGQEMFFTVDVGSNASAPIKDMLVHIDYPFGFTFKSSDPAPIATGLWSVGDLSPGQHKEIAVRGILSGEPGDSRVFHITTGTRAVSTALAIDTPLSNNSYPLAISQPFLGLTISVNKNTTSTTTPGQSGFDGGPNSAAAVASLGTSSVISPGDTVSISVEYTNHLATEINDAIIVARLSGLQIDGSTVGTADGFYRSTDNTVLWDKTTTNGVLKTLAPGAKGTVSFTFKVPSSADLKNVSNPHLDISVNAAGKRLSDTGVPQNLQSVAQQRLKLATDLELNAQALYYANPFVSTGPLPPTAGTETTYALVFTITNTTNALTGAKVTATLPPYVRWIGSHAPSTESLIFNQADGTFTWNVGDIAPGVGTNGLAPRQMAISIGFTPSTSQIGEQPSLVKNITLTGTDAATGKVIKKTTTPEVNTNLSQVSKTSSDALVGTDPGFTSDKATVVPAAR